jgi:hypothetical protein
VGRDSSVGIATHYWINGLGIVSREREVVQVECKCLPFTRVKRKGKVHSIACREGEEEECRYCSTLSLTSALDENGWLRAHPVRFTPRKGTLYPLYRKLWVPHGQSTGIFCILFYSVRTSSVLCFFFWLSCILPFVFYLQDTTQTSMPPAEFKPATPASDWPQTLSLDLSAIRSPDSPARSE